MQAACGEINRDAGDDCDLKPGANNGQNERLRGFVEACRVLIRNITFFREMLRYG